jgi:hypothetical protein
MAMPCWETSDLTNGAHTMSQRTNKLTLSKETLRTLDDQDLTDVVGGRQTGVVCVVVGQSVACILDVNTVICNSGICNSVACDSVAICQ